MWENEPKKVLKFVLKHLKHGIRKSNKKIRILNEKPLKKIIKLI